MKKDFVALACTIIGLLMVFTVSLGPTYYPLIGNQFEDDISIPLLFDIMTIVVIVTATSVF